MSAVMLWLMMLAASIAVSLPAPKNPSIGVFIDFDATPSPRSVEVMKKEAAKIMNSAGYKLDWRALRENRGKEAFSNLLVVKFHGRCRLGFPSSTENEAFERVILASTLVQDGHVLPFSDVQCDQVRKGLASGVAPDRQKALGLALGRVVAHELYHLVADTTRHAGTGLAKATQTWLDLVTGAAAFQEWNLPQPAK